MYVQTGFYWSLIMYKLCFSFTLFRFYIKKNKNSSCIYTPLKTLYLFTMHGAVLELSDLPVLFCYSLACMNLILSVSLLGMRGGRLVNLSCGTPVRWYRGVLRYICERVLHYLRLLVCVRIYSIVD